MTQRRGAPLTLMLGLYIPLQMRACNSSTSATTSRARGEKSEVDQIGIHHSDCHTGRLESMNGPTCSRMKKSGKASLRCNRSGATGGQNRRSKPCPRQCSRHRCNNGFFQNLHISCTIGWNSALEDLLSDWSWLRGVDLNHRPLGYEPNELPDCSTPQDDFNTTI
jgi:hypothetical protein